MILRGTVGLAAAAGWAGLLFSMVSSVEEELFMTLRSKADYLVRLSG